MFSKKKKSWQDDKSWSEIDKTIQAEKDRRDRWEKHGNDGPNIKIPIYSSDGKSLWGYIKKFFGVE